MVKSEPDRQQQLAADAVRSSDVTDFEAWSNLSSISTNTIIDSIEVFDNEIIVRGNRFTGPLLWHVTLQYGNGADEFTSSDSFPGTFEGSIEDGLATVTKLTADTSSFYE
jgi:hypothetical protein